MKLQVGELRSFGENTMTEDEKINLKELLKSNICEVKFTKVNGEVRNMKCTLVESFLPDDKAFREEHLPPSSNTSVISVWDIDSNGWRSFRWDYVESFAIKEF